MNLYKLTRHDNPNQKQNKYYECVVLANSPESAINIHPNGRGNWLTRGDGYRNHITYKNYPLNTWVDPKYVTAELIGKADKPLGTIEKVICACYYGHLLKESIDKSEMF